MAIPAAPQIVQAVTTAVTAGTVVAHIAPATDETAEGPFTFSITDDGGGAVEAKTDDVSPEIVAAQDIAGDISVAATINNPEGASPPTTQAMTFAEPPPDNPYDDNDEYAGNPQLPPSLPADATELPWDNFIVMATKMLVPRARDGVDFVVARPAKTQPHQNIHWDAALLGARPDAEIEALARELAAAQPYGA